jgi:hypothetical protein
MLTVTSADCCLLLQVALADAAIVTGLHIGAHLPLSVSFAIAVAANMVLVLLLLGLLVAARLANAANNSRLAEAANSPEVRGAAGGVMCWAWLWIGCMLHAFWLLGLCLVQQRTLLWPSQVGCGQLTGPHLMWCT